MDWIKQIDSLIVTGINSLHTGWLDQVMIVVTSRLFWIPLYVWMAFLIYRSDRQSFWLVVVSVILLIVLSDQLSVLIKNAVERYRPCYHLLLKDQLHLPDGCGGLYGFVSSHAANSSALSVFMIRHFRGQNRLLNLCLLLYCLLIAFSRIYLGRHYLTDILGGWALGFTLALLIYSIVQKMKPHIARKI